MKKILHPERSTLGVLIIILVLISYPSYSYAAWACLIKDKSAQVLLDYIKNNRIVVKSISNSINNNADKIPTDYSIKWEIIKEFSKTEGLFNETFNFDWFYSYARYFAIFPIKNEVPYEVSRDYSILEDEINWLMSYLKKINSRWIGSITVKNPCAWVNWNCNYKDWTVKEILWELINNNNKILDLFRLTVMWEKNNIKIEEIKLVNNNFILEIKKYYSKEAINECNNEEWWFAYLAKKAIEEITYMTEQWKEWIQKWKDAWQLLVWNRPEEEAEIEREQLLGYMRSTGISTDSREIILNNLEKYNLEWISINNNFITNTFDLIKTNIEDELRRFKEEVINDSFKPTDWKTISTREIKNLERNSEITKQIQENIATLYESELPFAAIWDIGTEELRARIIETHLSLEKSIRTLDEVIPRSQNICNSQGWGWNCN